MIIIFHIPKLKKQVTKQLELSINYQLNFSGEYTLVVSSILFSLVLSFLLAFFAATMSNKRHEAVFNITSQQIKNDFSLVNNTTTSNREKSATENDILEIPELRQGINEIKILIKNN
jgi:uncharacterized membrane protein YvbJ